MPVNRKQRYLEKISSLESEMVQRDLSDFMAARKGRRTVFYTLLGLLLVSAVVFLYLLQTDRIILIEPTEPPFQISLLSADTDNADLIRVFLSVIWDQSSAKKLTFQKVKASLIFHPSNSEIEGGLIPIYLKNGEINLMVMVTGIKIPPGSNDISLKTVNENGDIQLISINQLARKD